MKFCPECQNLLYIVEEDTLYEQCKSCGYREKHDKSVIITKSYVKTSYKNSASKQFMVYDPSYAHTIHYSCPNEKCESHKDPSLQDAIVFSEGNELSSVYICTLCKYEWKYTN